MARSPGEPLGDVALRAPASEEAWGSDHVADVLRQVGVPYLALVPGSSLRGLHDSIVNHLGNERPSLLLAIDEESAVAIAHGYAKVTGSPMGAAVHANVGLMRASMAVYNAWCDRAPLLLIGGTGPWDAARRRPWIDWVHTGTDQGALVRHCTKWDNQPGSAQAAAEAILRAVQIAGTAPRGPVYVNLDTTVQESRLAAALPTPDARRFAPPPAVTAPAPLVEEASSLLARSARPVILAGRVSRDLGAWTARIALAERLGAAVITGLGTAAAFPTDHPLHVGAPGWFLSPAAQETLEAADLVLSLDWPDLAGALRQAYRNAPVAARVIHVSCDAHNHRGFSADHQGLPPIDLYLLCEPDAVVGELAKGEQRRSGWVLSRQAGRLAPIAGGRSGEGMLLAEAVNAVRAATDGAATCVTRVPLGWNGSGLPWRHPLDYVGHDGGAGIGSGPGITVGAALALRGTGRVALALLGDGDFLMGNTAIWTAAHYGLPAIFVVCNNAAFHADERHQARVAATRGRPAANAWIGERLSDPLVDIAGLARSLGAQGVGPVYSAATLQAAVGQALEAAARGQVTVIDARIVEPRESLA